jgi:hypothetical protein
VILSDHRVAQHFQNKPQPSSQSPSCPNKLQPSSQSPSCPNKLQPSSQSLNCPNKPQPSSQSPSCLYRNLRFRSYSLRYLECHQMPVHSTTVSFLL